MSNISKLRIKFGEIEIEYEGGEDFIKNDLTRFIENISKLRIEAAPAITSAISLDPENITVKNPKKVVGTTSTIAAKLDVRTAPDLILAAAAYFTVGLGQDSFSRDDLGKEIKTAKSYYKQTHTSNLGKSIDNLVKNGRLNELARNKYALSASELNRINSVLD